MTVDKGTVYLPCGGSETIVFPFEALVRLQQTTAIRFAVLDVRLDMLYRKEMNREKQRQRVQLENLVYVVTDPG